MTVEAPARGSGLRRASSWGSVVVRFPNMAGRTACVFLADNGCNLDFDPLDAVWIVEDVEAGHIDKHELANWLRLRLRD